MTTSRVAAIRAGLPALLLIAFALVLFPASGRDDVYITLWPMHTLAESGQIVNYNGERVEQSSTLLFVVAGAALSKLLPIAPIALARLISLAAALIGLAAIQRSYRRVRAVDSAETAWWASLFTATAAGFVYWSSSGMEATLTAALSVATWVAAGSYLDHGAGRRRLAGLALLVLAFLMVRPEAPFVIACALLGSAALAAIGVVRQTGSDRASAATALKRTAILLGCVGGLSLALFAFRQAYFGSLFPQPVIAKAGDGLQGTRVVEGLQYLWGAAAAADGLFPFLIVAAALAAVEIGFTVRSALRGETVFSRVLLATYCVAWLGEVVASGGDWMEGGRMLVHVVPLLMLLAACAVARMRGAPRWRRSVAALVVAVQLPGLWYFASHGSMSLTLREARHPVPTSRTWSWFEQANLVQRRDLFAAEELSRIVGAWETRNPGTKVKVWSRQMGFVAYATALDHFGQVEFVDLFGITDRHLTTCPLFMELAVPTTRGLRAPDLSWISRPDLFRRCPDLPRPDLAYLLQAGPPPDLPILYAESPFPEALQRGLVSPPQYIVAMPAAFSRLGTPEPVVRQR